MRSIWIINIILISFQFANAQIRFENPSFEGNPQDGTSPAGWFQCKAGSTPDILPGSWGVYKESSDGNTYVGLITREDGTWEDMIQRLSEPIKKGECYNMSLDLARSKTYAGYNLPVKLRIWGGKERCSRDQMLAQSVLIKHTAWHTYTFEFNPKEDYQYIIIEAFFANGYFSYKGNILIDNVKPLRKCVQASVDPVFFMKI
jgi:hypothetical protein